MGFGWGVKKFEPADETGRDYTTTAPLVAAACALIELTLRKNKASEDEVKTATKKYKKLVKSETRGGQVGGGAGNFTLVLEKCFITPPSRPVAGGGGSGGGSDAESDEGELFA